MILHCVDVIHTVGPRSEIPDILANCYRNSLKVLKENGLKTIAFPCISTGIFGYDKEKAANVALQTVHDDLSKDADKVIAIRWMLR